ncbi:inactive serine/threonine-protein kinase TEX14 isoform X1 [Latimeria chalumnae]
MKDGSVGFDLHESVREGNYAKVKKILKKGVDVDIVNSLGQTPLFVAALLGLANVVKLLLNYGADPNHRCEDRSTPVHAASFSCNQWILSKLLDAGGDLRLHDKDGQTPQNWAATASKECGSKMVEFMQRCASYMQGLTRQNACDNLHLVYNSSDTLICNPSMLSLITKGSTDIQLSRLYKNRRKSSESVYSFGYGKFYLSRTKRIGYLACIPIIKETELLQADDEPTFTYCNGPYMTMANSTWNGSRVTVKELNPPTHQSCSKSRLVDLLIVEQENSSKLRHPHLLQLMAVCLSSDLEQIRLVHERVHLGSLYNILHERRSEFPLLHMETIVYMLLQLMDGLIYLHAHGFLHRAFTSHAVQLVAAGITKISNFEYMVESNDGGTPIDHTRIPFPLQLYNWLAPEIIRGKPATVKSDIYSFCTLIQELFTDAAPWYGLEGNAIKDSLAAGQGLAVDARVPKPYYGIVRTGIAIKPQGRTMSLQDIRYVLKNDIKDLALFQQGHTGKSINSEKVNLHPNINIFLGSKSTSRRVPEDLPVENHEDNDNRSRTLIRHTSVSPDKEVQTDVKTLNDRGTQYDTWRTAQEQTEDGKFPKLQKDYSLKLRQGEFSSTGKSKEVGTYILPECLEELTELDHALEKEMKSPEQKDKESVGEPEFYQVMFHKETDTHSGAWVETATEYTTDDDDRMSEVFINEQNQLLRMKKTDKDISEQTSTNTAVAQAISSCVLNFKMSQTLVQQAEETLHDVQKKIDFHLNTAERNAKNGGTFGEQDVQIHCRMLRDIDEDEVDSCVQTSQSKFYLKDDTVSSVAIAPPLRYQPPNLRLHEAHSAADVEHFPEASKMLRQTVSEPTTSSKRIKTRKVESEESDYNSTAEENILILSGENNQSVKDDRSSGSCGNKYTNLASSGDLGATTRVNLLAEENLPQNCAARRQVQQRRMSSIWANEVTEVIEKMTSGLLKVVPPGSEEDSLDTESEDIEELLRQFDSSKDQKKNWPKYHHRHTENKCKAEPPHYGTEEYCTHSAAQEQVQTDTDDSSYLEHTFKSFAGAVYRVRFPTGVFP